MSSPADGANGGLFPGGGIERSVGYLFIGIGVILLFLLSIMGMGRVEKITTDVTHFNNTPDNAPVSEIGGVGELPGDAP
ncbi:hypothetical protein GC163_07955 [bacterium]|nr:hypothetical protein [bacterium]